MFLLFSFSWYGRRFATFLARRSRPGWRNSRKIGKRKGIFIFNWNMSAEQWKLYSPHLWNHCSSICLVRFLGFIIMKTPGRNDLKCGMLMYPDHPQNRFSLDQYWLNFGAQFERYGFHNCKVCASHYFICFGLYTYFGQPINDHVQLENSRAIQGLISSDGRN